MSKIILKETRDLFISIEESGYFLYQNGINPKLLGSVAPHRIWDLIEDMENHQAFLDKTHISFESKKEPANPYKRTTHYYNYYRKINDMFLINLVIDMYYETNMYLELEKFILDVAIPLNNNIYINLLKENFQEILGFYRNKNTENSTNLKNLFEKLRVTGNSETDNILYAIYRFRTMSNLAGDNANLGTIDEILYKCINEIRLAYSQQSSIYIHYFLKKLIDLCPIPYDKSRLNV